VPAGDLAGVAAGPAAADPIARDAGTNHFDWHRLPLPPPDLISLFQRLMI